MAVPAAAPKKPANQGGKAKAFTQPLATGVPSVSASNGVPHRSGAGDNAWLSHTQNAKARAFRGSGKGAA